MGPTWRIFTDVMGEVICIVLFDQLCKRVIIWDTMGTTSRVYVWVALKRVDPCQ